MIWWFKIKLQPRIKIYRVYLIYKWLSKVYRSKSKSVNKAEHRIMVKVKEKIVKR